MKHQITVREATFADIEDMLPMTTSLYSSLNLSRLAPYDGEYIENFLATAVYDADKLALVAVDGDAVIGMLVAHTQSHWFSPLHRYAQELMFWVIPEARGSGAGNSLIKAFELWAAERNLTLAAMSRSGSYQCEQLDEMYSRRGYREESVIYLKEVGQCHQ